MKLPDVTGMVVAVDTEGSGLFNDDGARVSVVSAAWRQPGSGELVSVAVPFDQGYDPLTLPLGPKSVARNHLNRIKKWDPDDLRAPNRSLRSWDHLLGWLSRQQLVWQNAKHDLLQILAGQRDRPRGGGLSEFVAEWPWDGGSFDLEPMTIWDTMLASGQLWPGETTSLKPTSVRLHVGAEIGIDEGAEAAEAEALDPWKGPATDPRYDLIPWRVLGPYAGRDAQLTYLLYERQLREMNDRLQVRVDEEMALMRVLYRMERRGVPFNRDGCLAELQELDRLITKAAAEVPFRGANGRPTPPAAVKYFFGPPEQGGLGLIPFSDKMTKGGKVRGPQPQVDEEAVARLVKMEVSGAAEFAAYQELQSARSKWYAAFPALCGPDGRLRTCHRQGRVVSGRLSVERFQAQALPHSYQIPRGLEPIRSFIGDDGTEYEDWEADASQAEIRVATYVAKESNMLRALRKGVDSHNAACKLMFYPDLSLADALKSPDWEFKRQVAKRCNLGILYGIGGKELTKQIAKFTGIEVTIGETRGWIDDWKQAFPGFARALYEWADRAAGSKFVRLCTGKVRMFADYEPVHKAFNQRVQGDVAEAMRIAMTKFDREYPDLLLLQIHDSLVARVPLPRVEEVTTAMPGVIVSTFSRLFGPVPFEADVKPFGATAYHKSLR